MRQLIITPAQIAEILRGRCKVRRISQAELAGKLGIGQARLSTLEADPAGITLERLLLLARLLGLELVLQDKSETPDDTKAAW